MPWDSHYGWFHTRVIVVETLPKPNESSWCIMMHHDSSWFIMIHHDSSSCLHEITISGFWTPHIHSPLRHRRWFSESTAPGGIHVGLHLFRRSGDQQDPCEAAQPRGPPRGPACDQPYILSRYRESLRNSTSGNEWKHIDYRLYIHV